MRPSAGVVAMLTALMGGMMSALPARCEDVQADAGREEIGISGNPAATNQTTGTGWLGRQLRIDQYGFQLGGVWIGGVNELISGGVDPGVTFNSAFILDLLIDMARVAGVPGASIGVDFLQFNSQATNTDAGSGLGYIGMLTSEPYNRSELLELWWRQELFDKHLIVRLGKSNPAIDFQDVVRPVANHNKARAISTVTKSLVRAHIRSSELSTGSFPRSMKTQLGLLPRGSPVSRTTSLTVSLMGTRRGAFRPASWLLNSTATIFTLPRQV